MSARVREAHLPVHLALLLMVFLSLGLAACESDSTVDDREAHERSAAGDEQDARSSGLRVAQSIPADAETADFSGRQQASALLDAAHVLFMHAARARDSEMGHEAYRPELRDGFMEEQAWAWLPLIEAIQSRHADGIALRPTAYWDGEDWVAEGEPRLADYVWGVYVYHMHHREGWFEDGELRDSITRYPLGLLTGMARHVYDGFYADGHFHDGSDEQAHDLESMMDGLAASHAMSYAWLRWHKPDGEADMGALPEEQLASWLGRNPEQLLEKARVIAGVLDEAWQETPGYYRFDAEEMSLETLGSLLRGHKGLYEILHVFGDESDQEIAKTLFERSAGLLEQAIALGRDWGLPSRFHLGEEGLEVASKRVDVAAHWDLIAHLSAGFSYTRERDGTAEMMARHDSGFAEDLGRWIDEQIQAALDHQMPEGILVTALDFETGEVKDPDHQLRAISRFMKGAGEGYGSGDVFIGPADWQDAPEKAEATRKLYQALWDHGVFVQERLITGAN